MRLTWYLNSSVITELEAISNMIFNIFFKDALKAQYVVFRY